MLDSLLSVLAPHHCYQCGNPPKLLCSDCIKYNTNERSNDYFIKLIVNERVYEVKYISLRCDSLKELVDGFKFERQKSAYKNLATLLYYAYPQKEKTIITTIPTSHTHQRARGYDHMRLITGKYAQLCGGVYYKLLEGERKYYQHKMSLKDRQKMAIGVFNFNSKYENIPRNTPIVLLDDIYTTGNTMAEAIKTLNKAGYSDIRPYVILKQPFSIDR